MRTLFCGLLFCISFSAISQSNVATTSKTYKTVTVTNWVEPGPYLRTVNGQLYNAYYSKLWGDPIKLSKGLRTLANNGHFIRYELVVGMIKNDTVLCKVDAVTWWPETYTDVPHEEDRETIKSVILYHCPNAKRLVTGQTVTCLCMRVDNYSEDNISYEAYDCGEQSTNLVPVVKATKVPVTVTNGN